MRLALPIGAPGVPVPLARTLPANQGSYTLTGQVANLAYAPIVGSGTITHGQQLVPQGSSGVNVGPTALLGTFGYPGNLETMSVPSRGYWRTDTPDEFAPTSTYVYNNTLTNKGGVVPAGGMVIDGFTIPAGTRVVQFRDFSAGDFFASDPTKFMFRGCRFRNPEKAPGLLNNTGTSGAFYIFFCDAGGVSAANADYNEVPFKLGNGGSNGSVFYRNYITYTTTGIQINSNQCALIENYISKMTYYYGPNPPPGETTDKHLNGFTTNGGINSILLLRNYITLPSPDDAGHTINQTDCISFFQDFGTFIGSGTNPLDGNSVGFQVRDNYVGGGGIPIYCGLNAGKASSTVTNFQLIGNKVTTQWWPQGGAQGGPTTAEPPWGTNGNVKSGNTWADGPLAGQGW